MVEFIVALVSFFLNWLIVSTVHWHGDITYDNVIGKQKFHKHDVPRIGGLAVFFAVGSAVFFVPYPETKTLLWYVFFSSLPVFFAGFGEDLRDNINAYLRLAFAFLSAAIFINWSGYYAHSIEIPVVKYLFQWFPTSVLITATAIAGTSNAINIIDGFNGLASGSLIIMFATLGAILCIFEDIPLALLCYIYVAAIFGFFLWNFPKGHIFMGDGGAYFLGFALGAAVIMAFERNPTLSPWSVTLVLAYPLMETLFSIYRKTMRRGHKPSQPDRVHLHMLIRRSFARKIANKYNRPQSENAITGALMWVFPFLSCVLALIGVFLPPIISVIFWIGYIVFYLMVYRRVSLIAPSSKRNGKKS